MCVRSLLAMRADATMAPTRSVPQWDRPQLAPTDAAGAARILQRPADSATARSASLHRSTATAVTVYPAATFNQPTAGRAGPQTGQPCPPAPQHPRPPPQHAPPPPARARTRPHMTPQQRGVLSITIDIPSPASMYPNSGYAEDLYGLHLQQIQHLGHRPRAKRNSRHHRGHAPPPRNCRNSQH